MNITEFLLARIAEDEAKALGSGLLGCRCSAAKTSE